MIVICAPYKHLVKQWADDVIKAFPDAKVILVSSENPSWEQQIKQEIIRKSYNPSNQIIIISTIASFQMKRFLDAISKSKDDKFLIVDEAHRFTDRSEDIKDKFKYLLGLSATPFSGSSAQKGKELMEDEKRHIRDYLDMLPPRSFTSLYNEFSRTAQSWGRGYDKAKIENYICAVLDNNEQAAKCDEHIRELDDNEKKSPDIEDLIVARQEAETDIELLDTAIANLGTERKKYEIYLKHQMQEFDKLTKETSASENVVRKIRILEQVSEYFSNRLAEASITYSKRLEENIQDLIDQMLTSKRNVTVSSEFSVKVTDSFNDESKSEGQFAVVSFAYIGGILKMLRSEEHLQFKQNNLAVAKKAFEESLKKESMAAITGRLVLLLEDLQDYLFRKLIAAVEHDLKMKFGQLIRKKDFFDDIVIDRTWNVHIIINVVGVRRPASPFVCAWIPCHQ